MASCNNIIIQQAVRVFAGKRKTKLLRTRPAGVRAGAAEVSGLLLEECFFVVLRSINNIPALFKAH